MGAAAFPMAEFLNLPYATIIIAAIIPAIMHFFGVLMQVHFEAKRSGMRGLTDAEIPKLGDVFRQDWPTITPLVALVTMLFSGYTPYLAAFWGITGCMLLGLTRRREAAALIFALVIGIGAPFEPLRVTGVHLFLTLLCFAAMAHGVLTRGEEGRKLFNVMVDAFIIGAKYAIGVGAAAATVGIIVGVVTLTGNAAFRLALGKVLVPFVFVFSPSMLIMVPNFTWTELILSIGACFASITMLSAVFAGWFLALMSRWERTLVAIAALPVIIGSPMAILTGAALAVPVLLSQICKRARMRHAINSSRYVLAKSCHPA